MDNSRVIDPTLNCGCNIKVDLDNVVYVALASIETELNEIGVIINQKEDADIFPKTDNEIQIERKYLNNLNYINFSKLENFQIDDPDRAIVLFSVMQKNANIDYLSNIMLRSYRKVSNNFHNLIIGKGHTIKGAKSQNEELILFDYIKQNHGTQIGYTVANNDTIQIIDPIEKLSSPTQIYPSLNNALNDVILYGAIDNLKMYPIFDSPNEKIKDEMKNEIENYADEFKIDLIGLEPLNIGSSLIGSTVFGEIYKEPPIFYTNLESGDKILVHRSFGDLAPINAYIYNDIMCENGFSKKELKLAKEKIISVIKKPNLEIGKIINKYCPNFGEKLDRNKHILITKDISGEGISIFKELAEKSKKDIHITDIPLFFDEITKATVENFLIRDGTIGTNGAIVMIASENVIEQIKNDLNSKGFNPHIMGFIGDGCSNKVYAPKIMKDLIYSEKLNNFYIT